MLVGTRTARRRAYNEMLLAGALWGTIGPAVVVIADHTSLSPLQTLFWRLVIAIVPLTAVAVISARARPSRAVLGFGLLVGGTMGASQLTYFAAVADSGIAVPTLISNGLCPILTAVGQTVIFRSRPDRRTLLALLAALVGLMLLVLGGPASVTPLGVALAITSATAYAASTLAAGPASRRLDTTTLNAAAVAGAVLAITPFVLLTGGPSTPGSTQGWLAIGHLAFVVSGLAFWLYYNAASELPSTHITILALMAPLVAAILAVLFFDETLTVGAVVGGLLLLGAVTALRAPASEEPHPAATS